ncbi:MAG: hypothetical protein ACRCTJ_06815, partial [Brevinema sp.]
LHNQLRTHSSNISINQIRYIKKLSKDHISNLLAYCSKILNRSITNINYLSKQDGIKIINSLQRYHRS